jgi:hypothetical protein
VLAGAVVVVGVVGGVALSAVVVLVLGADVVLGAGVLLVVVVGVVRASTLGVAVSAAQATRRQAEARRTIVIFTPYRRPTAAAG